MHSFAPFDCIYHSRFFKMIRLHQRIDKMKRFETTIAMILINQSYEKSQLFSFKRKLFELFVEKICLFFWNFQMKTKIVNVVIWFFIRCKLIITYNIDCHSHFFFFSLLKEVTDWMHSKIFSFYSLYLL